jgi:hypothetical protein
MIPSTSAVSNAKRSLNYNQVSDFNKEFDSEFFSEEDKVEAQDDGSI